MLVGTRVFEIVKIHRFRGLRETKGRAYRRGILEGFHVRNLYDQFLVFVFQILDFLLYPDRIDTHLGALDNQYDIAENEQEKRDKEKIANYLFHMVKIRNLADRSNR